MSQHIVLCLHGHSVFRVGRLNLFLSPSSKDVCYISCVSDNPGKAPISRFLISSYVFSHRWQYLYFQDLGPWQYLWGPSLKLSIMSWFNLGGFLYVMAFTVLWGGGNKSSVATFLHLRRQMETSHISRSKVSLVNKTKTGSQSLSQAFSVMWCRASETRRLHGGGSKE